MEEEFGFDEDYEAEVSTTSGGADDVDVEEHTPPKPRVQPIDPPLPPPVAAAPPAVPSSARLPQPAASSTEDEEFGFDDASADELFAEPPTKVAHEEQSTRFPAPLTGRSSISPVKPSPRPTISTQSTARTAHNDDDTTLFNDEQQEAVHIEPSQPNTKLTARSARLSIPEPALSSALGSAREGGHSQRSARASGRKETEATATSARSVASVRCIVAQPEEDEGELPAEDEYGEEETELTQEKAEETEEVEPQPIIASARSVAPLSHRSSHREQDAPLNDEYDDAPVDDEYNDKQQPQDEDVYEAEEEDKQEEVEPEQQEQQHEAEDGDEYGDDEYVDDTAAADASSEVDEADTEPAPIEAVNEDPVDEDYAEDETGTEPPPPIQLQPVHSQPVDGMKSARRSARGAEQPSARKEDNHTSPPSLPSHDSTLHAPPVIPAALTSLQPSHVSALSSHRPHPSILPSSDDIPEEAHNEPVPPAVDEEELPPPSSPPHPHPSTLTHRKPLTQRTARPVHPEVEEEVTPTEPDLTIDEDELALQQRDRAHRQRQQSAKSARKATSRPSIKASDDEKSDYVSQLEEENRVLQGRVRKLSVVQKTKKEVKAAPPAVMAPFLDYSNRICELERELQSEKKERKAVEREVKRLEKECIDQSQREERLPGLLQKMSEEMTRERAMARKARERSLQAEQEVRRLTMKCMELEKRLHAQERQLEQHREVMKGGGGGTRRDREEEGRMEEQVQQHRHEMKQLHAEIDRHQRVVREVRVKPIKTVARPPPPPWGSHKVDRVRPTVVVTRPPRPVRKPTARPVAQGKKAVKAPPVKPAPQSQPLPPLVQLRADVKKRQAAVAKAQAAFSPPRPARLPVIPAPLIPNQLGRYPTHIPQLRHPDHNRSPQPPPKGSSPSRLPTMKGQGKGEGGHREEEHKEVVKQGRESVQSSVQRKEVEERKEMEVPRASARMAKISAREEEVEDEVGESVIDDDYDEDFD